MDVALLDKETAGDSVALPILEEEILFLYEVDVDGLADVLNDIACVAVAVELA